MTEPRLPDPPSPLVTRWAARLRGEWPAPRALDLACGRGRHALALARAGYRVTAVDIRFDALQTLQVTTAQDGLTVSLVCADLTRTPLPDTHFELIVVSRYLDRTLFPSLRRALVPGGVLVYETFTERQLEYTRGPRSRQHLLRPGELRGYVRSFEVLFDEEVAAPDAYARIVARRPTAGPRSPGPTGG